MTERRSRNAAMAQAVEIHRYWCGRRDMALRFQCYDPGEPTCYGCGWYPQTVKDTWRAFDRAHLVDRALGGLDDTPNLVLLCKSCHARMPMFEPGDEALAIAWVCAQEHYSASATRLLTAWAAEVGENGLIEVAAWMDRRCMDEGADPQLGEIPYGWRLSAISGTREVHSAEAIIVKWLIAQRQAGWSWRNIVERLNIAGTPGPRGGIWHASTARRIYEANKPQNASSVGGDGTP